MPKKKKYQPKITADEYEKLTGQKLGQLTGGSQSYINGVHRPTNG